MEKYEPYSCLDLTAMQENDGENNEENDRAAALRDYTRLLLVMSSRGLEFVKVPKVLH